MSIRDRVTSCQWLALVLLLCALSASAASAQTRTQPGARRQRPAQPPVVVPPAVVQAPATQPAPAAHESELTCGGFITQAPPATQFEIVGGVEEQERRIYGEGDYIFISGGAQQGVRVGAEFTVLRPRGQFKSKFSRKHGSLGVYTQELGRVRVVRVRDQASVAVVVRSCDNLLNGDLLRPAVTRVSPVARPDATLDRFAEPSGKQTGRIVLARDGRETVSRDDVVFIDLGAEDQLKPGDYLTVYRPVGRGVLVHYGDELAANTRRGFESDEFRGGKFSNQAQRVKDPAGTSAQSTVKTPQIRRRRPPVPRHIVGELVVLQVEGRTATAIVTRVAQEVHTGDYVEMQ